MNKSFQISTNDYKTNVYNESEVTDYPLISIITVVFNGEKYIEQTILSVINQTYKNIEYIIIDGGSTDSTIDIIKKYDTKITSWISEKDTGIYNAMNKGIRMAKGELIGIINSDDWYELDAVKKVVAVFMGNLNYAIFHGLLRTWNNDNVYSIKGTTAQMLKNDSLPHPATFIKRNTYTQYGLYNESYKLVADYELFLRYNRKNVNFYFIEEILANFRIGGKTTNSNNFLYEKFRVQYLYGNITYLKKAILTTALFMRNLLFK